LFALNLLILLPNEIIKIMGIDLASPPGLPIALPEIKEQFTDNGGKFDADKLSVDDFELFLKSIEVSVSEEKKYEALQRMTAAYNLLSLRTNVTEYLEHLGFDGEPIKVTENKMIVIKLAYRHYTTLLKSHLNMVVKDIQADVAEMYNISSEELIYISSFGEKSFEIEKPKKEEIEVNPN
jgi:DNA repair ATPase RecN